MPLWNILVHAGLLAKTPELFATAEAWLKCKKTFFVTQSLLIQAKEAVSSQCFDSLYRKEEKPCLDGQVSALILLESKVEGKPCPGS